MPFSNKILFVIGDHLTQTKNIYLSENYLTHAWQTTKKLIKYKQNTIQPKTWTILLLIKIKFV